MNIEEILKKVDRYFDDNQAKEAERLLLESAKEAEEKNEQGVLLQIYNELIGYYRQTSEKENLTKIIDQALSLAGDMKLSGTIPYATTALNAATGFRSVGEYDKAEKYYGITMDIYEKNLQKNDMLYAGLFNNMSLLFQERKNFQTAMEYQKKALEIVLANDAGFEIAVTYANLANTAVMASDYEAAEDYGKKAVECFQKRNLYDAHYCAAISALGMCYFQKQEYKEALKMFEEGMRIVETTLGKNIQYNRLKENRDVCLQKLNRTEEGTTDNIIENKMTTGNAGTAVIRETEDKTADKNSYENLQKSQVTNTGISIKGLKLSRAYYETYGVPMIREKFSEYENRIAIGLVGEGSDCFGFDDALSKDHDYGPDFCMWLDDEVYDAIGEALEAEYQKLPTEFQGIQRVVSSRGQKRRGVFRISDFYKKILGEKNYPEIQWQTVEDYALADASNGEIFRDDEELFSAFYDGLLLGYPENIRYLKLADAAAKFSQTGQYNYFRMKKRGDDLTAELMLADCMKYAMKLQHFICNVYPPHDKWLKKSTMQLPNGETLILLLEKLRSTVLSISFKSTEDAADMQTDEEAEGGKEAENHIAADIQDIMDGIGSFFAQEMYECSAISDINPYLDAHTDELVVKAGYSTYKKEELVDEIAKTEFKAFDKVKNEGGRASCQNDWPTFAVMRKSQYLTWNKTMLLQYIYDFKRELSIGHNLITEKYGRMMESTAPERYKEIKDNFPVLSEEKLSVINQIVAVQMSMAEDFAERFPKAMSNARSLHTYEDNFANTSYETYLRGEISTYSDKMLQLYAAYVIECAKSDVNIAEQTIGNTARLYGYESIEAFENSI